MKVFHAVHYLQLHVFNKIYLLNLMKVFFLLYLSSVKDAKYCDKNVWSAHIAQKPHDQTLPNISCMFIVVMD